MSKDTDLIDLQEALLQQKKRKKRAKELKDTEGVKYWSRYINMTKGLLRRY